MRNAVIVPVALLGLLLGGCSPKLQDSIVATVGDDPITLGDYEALYIKSNGSREHGEKATVEERNKFLDLMIRYRLKLADAHSEGLDRRTDVREEIDQYKGSLARSYLTERALIRPAVEMFCPATRAGASSEPYSARACARGVIGGFCRGLPSGLRHHSRGSVRERLHGPGQGVLQRPFGRAEQRGPVLFYDRPDGAGV